METILELEAARIVCLRHIELLNHMATKISIENKTGAWEPGKREKFIELGQKEGEWKERLHAVNGKLYDLVEKSFPIPATDTKQKATVN